MAHDLDAPALERWLEANVPGMAGPLAIDKFPDGQSNPTYRVVAGNGRYVLRRKPFGELLPSAHAVDREHRLLTALHPTGFPVPKTIALCDDPGVIGSIFYLMEFVEGRTIWNGALPDHAPAERRPIYEALVGTLARLHSIDPDSIGLQGFGRPGNYFARQVDRWTRQYRASQTDDLDIVEKLIAWLPGSIPEQTRTSIIHGDYRIDNLMFAPDSAEVAAVLDWELATIGDPLADFAYLAMNWAMPANGGAAIGGIDFAGLQIPTLADITALYCAGTGRDAMPDLHWYFAYNLFRLVGIVQGIKKRQLDGNASSAKADDAIARLPSLVEAAWEQARLAGAR